MILGFHIFMAIVSLFFAGYMSMHPVKKKLRITYITVFCTIISGIVLVMQNPLGIFQIITTGSLYLATIFVCTTTAHHKLRQAST
jgi:hypothetical protein